MKPPSKKMLGILKSKLNRYGDSGMYYYGGYLTYYEIKVLYRYFKLRLTKDEYDWFKFYTDRLKEGENGSGWFYFHREGNKKIFKELGLEL